MTAETTWVRCLPYIFSSKRGILFFRYERKGSRKGNSEYSFHRLKSGRLLNAISEIEEEKIYLKSDIKNPKQKLRELQECVQAIKKVSKAVDFFSWGGFKNLKYEYRPEIELISLRDGTLSYNPEGVLANSDLTITQILRAFVRKSS